MLSALELVGFKSFADKTRFEFPDGITVVVGPNGSGKSNIVDAIKWVLGSQSAKSLRGADMADVIFKGSAAGGRKPANSAEATLVFDNTKQILDVESTEVSVTRRVYRSGESEYLINRQPCRLKDIRDLFRGTGVGVDAYSLIEQGKVDRMLQASPKDRRAIFEEAAGISRFKAKKVDAQKRLGRVDQSLVRLRDIVDEVGSRLNALKNQAEKAQRYRQMTVRLEALRTQIGLAELQDRTDQKSTLTTQLKAAVAEQQQLTNTLSEIETTAATCETALAEKRSAHQSQTDSLQLLHRKHASLESGIAADEHRITELNAERELLSSRLTALADRVDMSAGEVERCRAEFTGLESEFTAQNNQLEQLQTNFANVDSQFANQRTAEQKLLATQLEFQSRVSQLENSVASSQSQVEQLEQTLSRHNNDLKQLQVQHQHIEQELARRSEQSAALQKIAETTQKELTTAKTTLEETQSVLSDRQENIVTLSAKLEGTRQRMSVLSQLENRREGVAHGAQQMIELSKSNPSSTWSSVIGMVADLIEIDLHLAPLIDVALGHAAETVVLSDGQLIQMLRDGQLPIEGRVSMIRLDRLAQRNPGEKIQLDGLHGVLGRADRMVHCDQKYASLIRQLLGTTWLVDTLDTALDLSHLRGSGLQFVTAACERIESDGTVMLGTLQSALGLVSRRSELQAAREEINHLEYLSRESVQEIARLQENIQSLRAQVRDADEAAQNAAANLARYELETESIQQRLTQNNALTDSLQSQIAECESGRDQSNANIAELTRSIAATNSSLLALTTEILQAQSLLQELSTDRQTARESATEQRVALAKIEQRLEGDRAALEQLTRDHDERNAAVREAEQAVKSNVSKNELTQQRLVQSKSTIEALASDQSTAQTALTELTGVLEQLQQKRDAARESLIAAQRNLEKHRDAIGQVQRDISQTADSLTELLRRYGDDYEIDLTDTEAMEGIDPLEDRANAEAEIAELRQSIASVGDVNMAALAELDSLQDRYDSLHGHYTDLTESKESLEKVIEKINVDSRELFMETLEAVRTNFQELYRKSFGGGSADIILEEGVDVLECGVEIVATPPGKTSLSNSLLSGGEKALTAVALIMAIFQFRPSPFCILDEVDAPFDEANIGRFVSVLKEFLDWTKFVVVTHSKKTMTAANTLYGVTMQESGVSKQVAVRFEDVEENGEIRKAA